MLKFAVIAAVGAVSAFGTAQAVSKLDRATREPVLRPAAEAVEAPAPAAAPAGAASVAKAADGHYWAEGLVNGARVRFLVDTGASAVALTADDARRLGFPPERLDYSLQVSTASGQARAAPVELGSVAVAGARVEKVQAVVLDRGLPASLLGMSYLGRLSRMEATPTALILRP
ncbi:MAG TPA: TIGR02281 family clan AA aspartic protease [Caulobacteraceae bacterium]|jgi:aspartyl protease family protein